MARAGETVVLPTREVTIHALDLVSWDGSDPERPIAILDVACSAGTYVRALARDLGEAVGSAAYLGALTRTASGPFALDDAVAARRRPSGRRRGPGRAAAASCGRSTRASTPSRSSRSTDDETAAVARGQFVRPAGGPARPPPSTTGCATPTGRLVAIATASGGRLAPDKVFVAPPRRSRSRSPDRPPMHVVQGVDELRPSLGPAFVVVGVFDGMHLGHAYLLEHLVGEAAARDARPDRHHLRPPSRTRS